MFTLKSPLWLQFIHLYVGGKAFVPLFRCRIFIFYYSLTWMAVVFLSLLISFSSGAFWSDETYTAEVISPPYNLAWYSCVASAKTSHFSRHLCNQHLSGKYWFTTQRVHNTSKSIIIFSRLLFKGMEFYSGGLIVCQIAEH